MEGRGMEARKKKKKTTDVKTSAYHVGPALTKVISVFPLYSSDIIHRLQGGGGGGGGGEQGGALLPAEKLKWREGATATLNKNLIPLSCAESL